MTALDIATTEDMRALGAQISRRLVAGDLVVLDGPLGAGKTTFAQGVGAGLGVTGPVLSPTFVVARLHRGGRLPLVHVDAYRLASIAEVDDLDLDASLAESVTVVEWGAGLVEHLADEHLRVTIVLDDASEVRHVTISPYGEGWARRELP